MAPAKADKKLRDGLYAELRRLQKTAMSGQPIPMPQRMLMKGHANALFDQWLELEAARFNNETGRYKAAVASLDNALVKLKDELDQLENAIRAVERATSVFKAVDRLLKLAVGHLAIP